MRALLELVRAPAAVSVPGDTMAGAAAAGARWSWGLGVASTLLYWSGMALNDWSDRDADARDRPGRPIPSGRISAGQALAAAAGLTAAGLTAAALSGGPRSLATAGLLAGAVWAYDLRLKHTPAGPAAMAACRVLDVLLGATSASPYGAYEPNAGSGPSAASRPKGAAGPGGAVRWTDALPVALAVGAHTYGVSVLGRAEVEGATAGTVAGALATTAAATGLVALTCLSPGYRDGSEGAADRAVAVALLAGYAGVTATAAGRLRVEPGPERVREAVRMGILAFLPLQASAVASRGRGKQAGALLAAHPVGRWLSGRMATS